MDSRFCDATVVAQKVIQGVYPGVSTEQLDQLAAETAAFMSTKHPDYSVLAARISASNLHKSTEKSFSKTMARLRNATHPTTKDPTPLLSEEVYDVIHKNAAKLDAAIVYDRDFEYDFFGFKTLERSYLLKIDGKPVERPQHMLMRVSVGIHREDVDAAIETYHLMSRRVFTHATPTLFNAGTPRPQMSSCFLLTMKEDSISGIYDTLTQCAKISKFAGGIGLSVHNVRAKGSYVAGTNGNSNGLVPMLRVFDATARYVDQGGGKRKGSFAIYLEPWHADVEEFLLLKRNHGKEENRARDLFYALWVSDLFMRRVEADEGWTLFCPNEAPGLADVYGEEFEALYERYEAEGRGRKTMKAQELWFQILSSQIETGTPYMLYKDHANRKSNQKNLGTIKSSNLCCEIMEFTSPDEVAVCNLASINLRHFVSPDGQTYDFEGLKAVTKVILRNLNKVIDGNYYPVEEARRSNFRHRPVAIGVQGLADAFLQMRFPFESMEAKKLNEEIFETIYFGACQASMELSKEVGPYETFPGSPMSKGIFQFDMWERKPNASLGWDWESLRADVIKFGVRNSLMVAPMPTASTSQILGNNEAFEPFTSNIYSRRVLAGDFVMVNQHLVLDLIRLNLWDVAVKNQIIADRGSVQNVKSIPDDVKALYKTVWEIKQRTILDMAADRGAWIDQSQSLNIHLAEPTVGKLTSTHFHAWRLGLKTGLYYLRTRPKADAIQFTIDQDEVAKSRAAPSTQKTSRPTTPQRETVGAKRNQNSPSKQYQSPERKFAPVPMSLREEKDDSPRPSAESEEEEEYSFSAAAQAAHLALIAVQEQSPTMSANNDDEDGCLMCGS